jgi:hypothetical protein
MPSRISRFGQLDALQADSGLPLLEQIVSLRRAMC